MTSQIPSIKPTDIRDELERVLTSDRFNSSNRSRQFLKYIVEQTLDGKAALLKGYSIALDVFEKPEGFDASTDPLVRVEGSRLRSRLAEYYLSEGRENPVRIDLPRGTYVPQFIRPRKTVRYERHQRKWDSGAAILSLTLVAVALFSPLSSHNRLQDSHDFGSLGSENSAPRIALSGFANLMGDSIHNDFVSGLDAELMAQLDDFGFPVISPLSENDSSTFSEAVFEKPPARFSLGGSVRLQGDMIRISARLLESASGAQIWAAQFDEAFEPAQSISIQERFAMRTAAILANPFGPIFDREAADISNRPLDQLDSYGCVVQFRAYAKSLNPAVHERSRSCFLRAIENGEDSAQIWAGLALIYIHEYWYSYNPQAGDALERAYEAALVASSIDDENLLASLALAEIYYSNGDLPEFRNEANRSIRLARNPSAIAQIGFILTLAGQIDDGRMLLDEAFTAELAMPSWYQVARSFNALLRGLDNEALDHALRANSPEWFVAPMAVAVAAGQAGQTELAAVSIERLLQIEPDFPRYGYKRLQNWIISPALVQRIVEGLQAGGLELCSEDCERA